MKLAVLAVFLFGSLSAVARPHAGGGTISLAPGVSLAVPGGWTACDAPTAAVLGAAPAGAALPLCAHLDTEGDARMFIRVGARGMTGFSTAFMPKTPFPEGFIEDAPLGPVPAMSGEACQKLFHNPAGVTACTYDIQSIGGHRSLFGHMAHASAGGSEVLYTYVFPVHGGCLIMIFLMTRAEEEARMRTIMAGLTLDTPVVVETEPELVELAPVPGVSLKVPNVWKACDDANDKLLGGRPDPSNMHDVACKPGEASDLHVYDPRPMLLSTLRLKREDENKVMEDVIKQNTPETLPQASEALCALARKPYDDAHIAVENCAVSFGTLAGHQALIFELITNGTGKPTAESGVLIREYDLLYDKGYLMVQIDTPVGLKASTLPPLERILSSFVIP
jgi:hypothetical protein